MKIIFMPELLQPHAPLGRILAAVGAAVGVGVARPEHDQLGVLHHVFEQVELLGRAHPPEEAPGVAGAPEPPLPAIGVVEVVGRPDHLEEAVERAAVGAHAARVVVRGAHVGDRLGAVCLADALHLVRRRCRAPRPSRCARSPTCRGSAGCGRSPVELESRSQSTRMRVSDAVVGVGAGLLGHAVRRDRVLAEGRELPAAGFERPGRDLLVVGEDQRTDADDLVVLDVDEHRAAAVADVGADLLGHQCPPPFTAVAGAGAGCTRPAGRRGPVRSRPGRRPAASWRSAAGSRNRAPPRVTRYIGVRRQVLELEVAVVVGLRGLPGPR